MSLSLGVSRVILRGVPVDGFKKGDFATLRGTTSGRVYEVDSIGHKVPGVNYDHVFLDKGKDWRWEFELQFVFRKIKREVIKTEIEFSVYKPFYSNAEKQILEI